MKHLHTILSEQLPFWDKLDKSRQELMLSYASVVTYKKGQNIHGGGNDCAGVMLIKSGVLRTYMLSEQGREITLYRLFAGDICVLSASCVLRSITFEVFIDAEEDSEVLLIASRAFDEIAEGSIYARCFLYETATARFSDVMWAMQQILFMSFDKRLAVFLTDELSKTSKDTIKLTHEQVAKYMGSAREVVSRMLKYFESEKILELSRGGIKIIDKKKLRSLTL